MFRTLFVGTLFLSLGCMPEEREPGERFAWHSSTHQGVVQQCGNHVVEPGEECDRPIPLWECYFFEGMYDNGGYGVCTECHWDLSECAHCGDGVVDVAFGEECDPPAFRGGAVGCTEACRLSP